MTENKQCCEKCKLTSSRTLWSSDGTEKETWEKSYCGNPDCPTCHTPKTIEGEKTETVSACCGKDPVWVGDPDSGYYRCPKCLQACGFKVAPAEPKECEECKFKVDESFANGGHHGNCSKSPEKEKEVTTQTDHIGKANEMVTPPQKDDWEELQKFCELLDVEGWAKQGRTEEGIWSVKNFLTGRGGIKLKELKSQWQAEARREEREKIVKDLALKDQKPEDFSYANGNDMPSFCRGYNACKEYVEWVLAGRPSLKSEQ